MQSSIFFGDWCRKKLDSNVILFCFLIPRISAKDFVSEIP